MAETIYFSSGGAVLTSVAGSCIAASAVGGGLFSTCYVCGCCPYVFLSSLSFSVGVTPLAIPPPSANPLSNLGAVGRPISVVRAR